MQITFQGDLINIQMEIFKFESVLFVGIGIIIFIHLMRIIRGKFARFRDELPSFSINKLKVTLLLSI